MKRLFIAINLPDELKNKIEQITKKITDFRWIPSKNWHLTLVFLGYQADEAIIPILESIRESAQNFPAPDIEFEKMILAPPDREPRMVWLNCTKQTSKILGEIKNKLENDLITNRVTFKIENRPFNSHLTLMRFSNDSPILTYEIVDNLHFTSQSIDLMESHLKRSGAEYDILTKVDFIK